MAKYTPLNVPVAFECVNSDMIQCEWRQRRLIADFAIPNDPSNVIRVEFARAHIVRTLDEMPLSTEETSSSGKGLVSNHFAYSVEDALFWRSQSEAFRATKPNARHYRFITGWTRLDVIAEEAPEMSVQARKHP
jgi:hypothetical protein